MRAGGISRYGGGFEAFDAPEPVVADDQVLVRVAAAGIGLWDAALAAGAFGTPGPLPRTLGWEGSGTVERVGAAVHDLAVGDAVIGYDRAGGWYAELVAIPAAATARAPRGVDLVTAAALPIAGSSAWQSLVDVLGVRPGETVLVTGGAGATGLLAVQLARHLGATVVSTAGPDNLAFVRGLGATAVHDHTHGARAVLEALRADHPDGVDVLLDTVDADNVAALTAALRPGGRAASLTPPLPAGLRGDVSAHPVNSTGERDTLRTVVELTDAGVLTPVVHAAFALEDVAAAHAQLATRRGRGKIVLVPPAEA